MVEVLSATHLARRVTPRAEKRMVLQASTEILTLGFDDFFWVQGGLFPPAPVASSRLFLAPQAGLLTVLVPLVGRLRSPGGRRRGVTFFLY